MYFQRIADLRTDADKTQQQIADLLHMKRQVYRRYEKGEREIPTGRLSSSPAFTTFQPTIFSASPAKNARFQKNEPLFLSLK